MGYRVPDDIALVGFDNWTVMAEAAQPPLTTVDMNLPEVGRIAAETLLSAIAGHAEHGTPVGPQPAGRALVDLVVLTYDLRPAADNLSAPQTLTRNPAQKQAAAPVALEQQEQDYQRRDREHPGRDGEDSEVLVAPGDIGVVHPESQTLGQRAEPGAVIDDERQEIVVPGGDEIEQEHRYQGRDHERDGHPDEDLRLAGPIEPGRVHQLGRDGPARHRPS